MRFRSHFTRDEAEALIPHIRPMVERALELVGKLRRDEETTSDEEELMEAIRAIESWGCRIRALDEGMVDFPTSIEGQPAFFSWSYPDPSIRYYAAADGPVERRRPLPGASRRDVRPN